MMRVGALLVAAVLLPFAALAVPAGAEEGASRYIVGYDASKEKTVFTGLEASGGTIKKSNRELGAAVVETNEPARFERTAPLTPGVKYVERDDRTGLAGAQWNGAQWNGAQWNGAQWNGAQWNGAQWNGAQWNGAQWNDAELKKVGEAQRHAAKWTETHFQAEGTNKMKWAGDQTDPGMVWQWSQWAANANFAWTAGNTGTRTASLCVLDSGVATTHRDIAPNLAAAHNVIDPAASGEDDAGHGTHIAGIAAGSLADGYGVAGVGNVRIFSAKVLSADGTGYESDLAFGLVWCAQQGADVAVMALSATDDGPTMSAALGYAAARDVLLLASAGNAGACKDCVAYPARDPRVVAVSAVDGHLSLASFSSRGAQVELAAPGVHMLGPFPGDAFVFGSGTSQAVAYAAGAATLLRDANPALTASQARAVLTGSARDLGAAGWDDAYGHGLVDVAAALKWTSG